MKKPPQKDPLAMQLNAKRLAWGMSIAEWARRSGVGEATIRHLMSGNTGPSIYTLDALAGVFGYELYLRPRPGEKS